MVTSYYFYTTEPCVNGKLMTEKKEVLITERINIE